MSDLVKRVQSVRIEVQAAPVRIRPEQSRQRKGGHQKDFNKGWGKYGKP